jgi:pilus assembly protein CpaB
MRRPIGFVALAMTAALLASIVVFSALKKREAELQRAVNNTVQIVVAARDLPLGTRIEPGAVRLARWARDSLPPGAIADPQTVMNSVVKNAFVENEPIVQSKLFVGEKTAGVLPLLIPRGMRAMSVPVDEVSDVAGFILPHSRVDVLVALAENSGNSQRPISKVVLQNVEVLAVAQEIEGKKDEPHVVKVVTLLVSPQDAERLALASREGTLRLALRNYTDNQIVLTSGSDIDSMLRAYSAATIPASRTQTASASRRLGAFIRPTEIEIMRDGTRRETVSFIKGVMTGGEEDGRSPSGSSPRIGPARKLAQGGPMRNPGFEDANEAGLNSLVTGRGFDHRKTVDVP